MSVLRDNFSELLLLSLNKVTYINGELLFVTDLWTSRGKYQKVTKENTLETFLRKINSR